MRFRRYQLTVHEHGTAHRIALRLRVRIGHWIRFFEVEL